MIFRKIKAHRGHGSVACEGHDALLSWAGNARVDALARDLARSLDRQGAGAVTTPVVTANRQQEVKQVLQWIATATAWALRHWPEGGSKPRKARRAPPSQHGVTTVGPHRMMVRRGGGHICLECHLFTTTPSSLRSLRQTPCRGTLTTLCHASHALRWTRGVLWCTRCGAYTIRRPRALRKDCPGGPASESARNVLRRLREGLPPPPQLAENFQDEIKIRATSGPSAPMASGGTLTDARGNTDDHGANSSVAYELVLAGATPAEQPEQHHRGRGRYTRLDARLAHEAARATDATIGNEAIELLSNVHPAVHVHPQAPHHVGDASHDDHVQDGDDASAADGKYVQGKWITISRMVALLPVRQRRRRKVTRLQPR